MLNAQQLVWGLWVDVVFLCREKVEMTLGGFVELFWFGFVFFGFFFGLYP